VLRSDCHVAPADAAGCAVAGLREVAADLLAKKTKNAATPPSTVAITARRLKMPQFMPAAMGESDWP
jgi:hypothetical protein